MQKGERQPQGDQVMRVGRSSRSGREDQGKHLGQKGTSDCRSMYLENEGLMMLQ